MVRSFLGRLVRIRTPPRIDVHRAVQQGEDAPVHAGAGGEMRPPPAPFPNDRQGQPRKAFEQALGRGAGGRPRRVPSVQPRQRRPGGGQALADDTLQPRQDPQPHRQPSDHAGGMVIPRQVPWGQGQGVPLQAGP